MFRTTTGPRPHALLATLFASVLALVLSGLFAAPSALAQSYPNRPIRIVIGFSPGGATDAFGRMLGQKLQERLGQPTVVENKPGAGGNIGVDYVAKSKPDGYTLLLAYDSLAIMPWLYKSLPFDVMRDLAPIGVGVFMPMIIPVATNVPAKTLPELIAWAKANPGKLSFGSPGTGTAQHLNFERLLVQTDARMVHVPYKGASQLMTDLLAGNLPVGGLVALSSIAPFVQQGKVRALAVGEPERVGQFKDLPTIAEAVPGFVANVWFGLMAPAGTPDAILTRLSQEMCAGLQQPDLRDRLTEMGYQIRPTTPAEMRQMMTTDHARWGPLVKSVGITPE